MANGRAVTAENLKEVLELARSRRYSGRLGVEHIQGGRVEDGEIYFQDGQPGYARVGQLAGYDALNWMLTWHNVRYTFITDVLRPQPDTAPIGTRTTTSPRLPEGIPSSMAQEGNPRNYGYSDPASQKNSGPLPPGAEWLVPQKRSIGQDPLSLPLSRRQRVIYLLIDGRRTIADLARTTGKSMREVELILRELQEQNLVSV